MAYADVQPVPFEIGRVVRRMTASIGRRWLLLGAVVVLFGVLPGLGYQGWLGVSARENAGPLAMFTNSGLIGAWVLMMIVGAFAQAAMIGILAADQQGETPALAGSLVAALAVLLPVIALKIVVWLSLGLAWLFFMVPALILFSRWFVALPALVVEQEGVMASLGRSSGLTDGARWRVFGLIAVIGVLYLALLGAIMPLGIRAAAGGGMVIGLALGAVQQLLNGVASAVWAAALASAFLELREIKEGAPASQLAEVFA